MRTQIQAPHGCRVGSRLQDEMHMGGRLCKMRRANWGIRRILGWYLWYVERFVSILGIAASLHVMLKARKQGLRSQTTRQKSMEGGSHGAFFCSEPSIETPPLCLWRWLVLWDDQKQIHTTLLAFRHSVVASWPYYKCWLSIAVKESDTLQATAISPSNIGLSICPRNTAFLFERDKQQPLI